MSNPWIPVALVIAAVLGLWLKSTSASKIGDWLYQWQALLGIGGALFAASLKVRNDKRLERHRRARKHAALRARLPAALSQIVDYARAALQQLGSALDQFEGETIPSGRPVIARLEIPSNVFELLSEFIEYSDEIDVNLAEQLAAWLQIQNSRYVTLTTDAGMLFLRTSVERGIIDAAAIHAGASAMFDYGRRRASFPPRCITWDHVRRIIWLHHLEDDRIERLLTASEKLSQGPFDELASDRSRLRN